MLVELDWHGGYLNSQNYAQRFCQIHLVRNLEADFIEQPI